VSAPAPSYFVTGGTLRPDAACYVDRDADRELFEGLSAADFCYVLTSRQMGKSSLMVRTVQQLRADGRGVAVLDLTAIGQNLTVEQWYTGLLERVGSQLDLEDELEDFWDDHQNLGPVQRWFAAIREVALAAPGTAKELVIFVDEIDAVRSLPFSTDEFFAAIRECYNRRSAEPELGRLTFCLLGVATPSDLIRDTRTTPFNIGRRIELRDFAGTEAAALEAGLENRYPRETATRFLERVMYWTNGQPYLTQLFCRSLVEADDISSVAQVDHLCRRLFLDERAAEKNDNLVFVRERMLRSEVDRYELLQLYDNVHRGRSVPDDPSSPLIGVLRLSGIVREENGFLKIRSPIYSRVFHRRWVAQNLPDAEVRRQRQAYHRGLVRSAVWAALIISFVVYSWVNAWHAAYRADESASGEATAREIAELAQRKAEKATRQVSEILNQMGLRQAEEMFQRGRSATAVANLAHLLSNNPSNRLAAQRLVFALSQRNYAIPLTGNQFEQLPPPRKPDRKSALRLKTAETNESVVQVFSDDHSRLLSSLPHDGYVWATDISPDDRTVATAAMDDAARIWDALTGELLTPPLIHAGPVVAVRFSPDGTQLATASSDRTVRVWDTATGIPVTEPLMHNVSVRELHFSPSGKNLYTVARRSRSRSRSRIFVRAWDIRPGQMQADPLNHGAEIRSAQFSRDGRHLVTAAEDHGIRLWDTRTGTLATEPVKLPSRILDVTFSPATNRFITATAGGEITLWNIPDLKPVGLFPHAFETIVAAKYSPSGDRLLVALADGQISILPTGVETVETVNFHAQNRTLKAGFDPTGKQIVTIGGDKTLRFWNAESGEQMGSEERIGGPGPPFAIGARFSPDGTKLIARSMSIARLWNPIGAPVLEAQIEHTGFILDAGFDRDGERVYTTSMDRTVRLWDSLTGDQIGMPLHHSASVVSATMLPDNRRLLSTTATHVCRLWDLQTGQPIAEPFAAPHRHVYTGPRIESRKTTRVSADGAWLAMATAPDTMRIWPLLDPPIPVPKWLPKLAVNLAGERINERGSIVSTDGRELGMIRKQLESKRDHSFYSTWGRWLLADRDQRPSSPWSELTKKQTARHHGH
jgi:WD40 repeat protein